MQARSVDKWACLPTSAYQNQGLDSESHYLIEFKAYFVYYLTMVFTMDQRLSSYIDAAYQDVTKLDQGDDLLSKLSDKQLKSLIGLAGLLKLVATIDDQELCPNEEQEILNITTSVFSIKPSEVVQLIRFLRLLMPCLKENGLYYFSNFIQETCNKTQHEAIIHFLQRVADADNTQTSKQKASILEINKILSTSNTK